MSDSPSELPWRLHDSQAGEGGGRDDEAADASAETGVQGVIDDATGRDHGRVADARSAMQTQPPGTEAPARARRRGRQVSPETLARSRVQAARRRIVQALYAFQLSPVDRGTLLADLRADAEHAKADDAYFERLLKRVLDHRSRHDEAIVSVAGRAAESIDPVERAVLWLAVEELESELVIPAAVVVSEALVIAGQFGAEHSHRFVHAVLEHLSRTRRPHETADRGALPRVEAPAEPQYPEGLAATGTARLAAAIEGGALPSADGQSQVRVRRRPVPENTPPGAVDVSSARAKSVSSRARRAGGDDRGRASKTSSRPPRPPSSRAASSDRPQSNATRFGHQGAGSRTPGRSSGGRALRERLPDDRARDGRTDSAAKPSGGPRVQGARPSHTRLASPGQATSGQPASRKPRPRGPASRGPGPRGTGPRKR